MTLGNAALSFRVVFKILNLDIQHRSYTLSMSQSGPQAPPFLNLSNSILAGGNFTQNNQILNVLNGERAGFARLLQNAAPNALYDSGHVVDPPKCHPNTRMAIIQTIIAWSLGTATGNRGINAKPILWLKGGAGAGKSAIARSVAERCSKERLLLGTFFFGAADTTRNHATRLVATLAYQICGILPELREMVTDFIEDDPFIFSRSINIQFTNLIIRPLSIILSKHSVTTQIPRLIIIDGLDECNANVDSQRDLLFTLQEVVTSTTLIQFLVCSRPESHLNNAFSSLRMANIHYKIFLDDDYSAREDIELYLEDKFREIKEGHVFKHTLPTTWPRPRIIRDLAYNSSGQFIYASTVVRYVESPRHRPDQRLDAALNLRPPFKDLPFTELDALYRHIISKAEDPSTVLDILAFPVLYGQYFTHFIEKKLQLEEGDVEVILADLQSLVTIDRRGLVKFLHKSLTDFLCDSQRAGDLYRDLSAVRVQHMARSISIVSTTFKHCGIRALTQNLLKEHLLVQCTIDPFLKESEHGSVHDLTNEKATHVSFDSFLQAAIQFPTFDLIKQMHADPGRDAYKDTHRYRDLWRYLVDYLTCLHSIKDIQTSARLICLQLMRQYCEAVLSVLEEDLSNDWKAHFIYTYYHLLGPRIRRLSSSEWFVPLVQQVFPWEGRTFGDFVYGIFSRVEIESRSRSFDNYLGDIIEISNDLTKGTKRETIFALSASFCLAFLCDNRNTTPDTVRIFEATGIDQHKRREHPWRWRRMNSRQRSLGNPPVITSYACSSSFHPMRWDSRLGNMRKAFRNAGTHYDSVLESRIFTIPEHLYYKHGMDKWPWKSIHRKQFQRQRQYQRLEEWQEWQEFKRQEWPLYMLLLDLLPRILSSSGRYEPLVTMCRKKCLASLSRCWPKKSRRAREAITAYLQRMDMEENK
ncbi:hypothetical protein D9613_004444 [Agrocybe pediades]|uniref:Nephrocystin 3-like N-terminal domain-containing protein n=1 Tax=Agrocybe pediades TaxID=84607 RepID=A0A8H4QIY2_9AGAR|nr:hypothetical protein D9613_004444 [Agrocybe pediades]